jgi:hypothetical protein
MSQSVLATKDKLKMSNNTNANETRLNNTPTEVCEICDEDGRFDYLCS